MVFVQPASYMTAERLIPAGMHLLVAIHGLWGHPIHLKQLVTSIEAVYPTTQLHVLVCESNAGNLTYDGVDVGAERAMAEIEKKVEELAAAGTPVTKISFVGYSMGGLIARYVVGMLLAKGLLVQQLMPVNFTTIATPHLGVKHMTPGISSAFLNALGGATLCASGRQLFLTDDFRNSGRCLLEVMADPESIFMKALTLFRRRSLYANILNDRTVPWYTASISASNPFVDMEAVSLRTEPGYDGVILDGAAPAAPLLAGTSGGPTSSVGRQLALRLPMFLVMAAVLPLGTLVFLLHSCHQTFSSAERVRRHRDALPWRPPLVLAGDDRSTTAGSEAEEPITEAETAALALEAQKHTPFPVLNLTAAQFRMIRNLDAAGWHKHPVHIRNVAHSHGAIIVRSKRLDSADGYQVCRHWVENFLI
eukprot:Protomagalhaensia_wolfi_Nauph_80__4308@NODE_43_length_4308_cov_97_382759_g35_i0_p1_GENE_NODE_43_length_4308_cov_97_382759_g35_i0NODE_43_length_4308_cov_97_382759_g35_i0_p1_ORF_typecomplete_len421_score44_81DUF676/PF05057_14/4_2e31DUF676/PF05057_14/15Palm_thioest/PF02089_15/1_8e09Palm_thioest/PF02089_15/2_3e02PGAP1/PF07819_13/6e09PGAP1/PF07819_13/2_3e02DUF915/PF06028_11/1_4e05DUF915/PF06028_11/5_5e02LCAT/PF02450_15/3e05LCAT/PF02450_15/4_7e02Lipase_2/PF01674_18/6e05Lipase_2/PF01674_18/5_3e02Thioes